jgi:hypothetical protein
VRVAAVAVDALVEAASPGNRQRPDGVCLPMRPVRLARYLVAAATLLSMLATAGPAAASCVVWGTEEEMLRDAEVAFVGTVQSVANADRWAMVAVEEMWIGPELAPIVEVRGGAGPGEATSVDRTYSAGTRYLIVASIRDGVLTDNACSLTAPWAPELARLRPAKARLPVAEADPADAAEERTGFDPGALLVPGVVVLALGGIVFGAVLVLRSRD